MGEVRLRRVGREMGLEYSEGNSWWQGVWGSQVGRGLGCRAGRNSGERGMAAEAQAFLEMGPRARMRLGGHLIPRTTD